MILLAALLAALILLAAGLGWGITALYYRARLAVAEDAVETSRGLVTEALAQIRHDVPDSVDREVCGLSGADEVRLAAIAADLTESRGVERALRRFERFAPPINPES